MQSKPRMENAVKPASLSLSFPKLSRVAHAQRRHLVRDGVVTALLVACAAVAVLGIA